MPTKRTLAVSCQNIVHNVACCRSSHPFVAERAEGEYRALGSIWRVAQEDFKILLFLHALVIWIFLLPLIPDVFYFDLHSKDKCISFVSSRLNLIACLLQNIQVAKLLKAQHIWKYSFCFYASLTAEFLDTWNQLALANSQQYDAELFWKCEPILLVEEYGIFAHLESVNTAFWNDQGSCCKSAILLFLFPFLSLN